MWNKYCKKNASNNGTKRHKAYHVWRKIIGQNKGLRTMWKKITGGGGAKGEKSYYRRSVDRRKILHYISEETTYHIASSISLVMNIGGQDKPLWIGNSKGYFSVKSA